jgi:F-type H+-transporting ATPase subunit epsilon
MTDAIENKSDIDVERAEAAKARAERRINSHNPNYDLKRAEIALQKALNRLEVKRH